VATDGKIVERDNRLPGCQPRSGHQIQNAQRGQKHILKQKYVFRDKFPINNIFLFGDMFT
jgi:hypothetical protein